MRKSVAQSMCIAVGIGLLGTPAVFADPVTVTSGHVTARMTNGTFSLLGDGLWLSGSPQLGYDSSLWQCAPCRAGDQLTLSLSSTAGPLIDSGLPGDFNHEHYEATWLDGRLTFTTPDITSEMLAGQTSISVPFTFSGELANYDSYASLAAAGNGSVPLWVATLTGSGIATAQFNGPVDDPAGALFFADRISYDFAPAPLAPTPEPASLLLLGTGAAGLAARVRRRVMNRGYRSPE